MGEMATSERFSSWFSHSQIESAIRYHLIEFCDAIELAAKAGILADVIPHIVDMVGSALGVAHPVSS